MNYTLHQLQIFLKVVKTQSITKAAEELHLTQPAVSIQLRNFQDQFDVPLTEIVGRKLYVTDFGQEIAQVAQTIIQQVETINYKTRAYKGQLSGRLKVTIVSTGKYVMPYFLADFVKKNIGIDLQMDVTNKSRVLSSLENNEVDFALVSVLPSGLNVDQLDLMQNRLYLVANSNLKFKRGADSSSIFNDMPLIFREKGSGTRQVMEEFIQSNGIFIPKKMELTSNEAVKQAVIAGIGCSIMPLIGIKNELLNHELQIIPYAGLPVTTTWSLIWPKGKKHSPVATSFLNYMRKERDNIVSKKFSWSEDF